MRILLTGASGYIGAEVARAFVLAGHEVAGVARTPEKAKRLEALGGKVIAGDYKDVERLAGLAPQYDAFLHTAIEYSAAGLEADRTLMTAVGKALRKAGGPRSLVYTSGVWVMGRTQGELGDERQALDPAAAVAWRPAHEQAALEAGCEGLAAVVLRPGLVYGGGHDFWGMFAGLRAQGAATYFGDGRNRWSTVHVEDLAQLYRLLVEKHARGAFLGVDGQPVTAADAAALVAAAAGKPGATHALPLEQARQAMGPMADALALDQAFTPRRAREELGWTPTRANLRAAVREAHLAWTAANPA
jgi:nucleoside-diphosphate-sugar epimerase